jgi:putative protein-disulfide isomerase
MAAVKRSVKAVPMKTVTLHYLFDPLCGWCYGAAPLLAAAHSLPGVQIELHAGGMLTGSNRRSISPQWRAYVLPHDRRIAELSGQPFGDGYFNGLLNDQAAVLDSEPPSSAILAAQTIAGQGLAMLQRLQQAHYVEGRRIADLPVLVALAGELGLPLPQFSNAYQVVRGRQTQSHIAASRALMAQAGVQGFPSVLLVDGQGRMHALDLSKYLGRPEQWLSYLRTELALVAGGVSAQ